MKLYRTDLIKARYHELMEKLKEPDLSKNDRADIEFEIGELKMDYFYLTDFDLSKEA